MSNLITLSNTNDTLKYICSSESTINLLITDQKNNYIKTNISPLIIPNNENDIIINFDNITLKKSPDIDIIYIYIEINNYKLKINSNYFYHQVNLKDIFPNIPPEYPYSFEILNIFDISFNVLINNTFQRHNSLIKNNSTSLIENKNLDKNSSTEEENEFEDNFLYLNTQNAEENTNIINNSTNYEVPAKYKRLRTKKFKTCQERTESNDSILVKNKIISKKGKLSRFKDLLTELLTKEEKKSIKDEKNYTNVASNLKKSNILNSQNDIKEDYGNTLSTLSYEEYLLEQKQNNYITFRETFCEGFFIASYPKKNAKIIEKSYYLPSLCDHEECSLLHAMKPEIIMRYPLKDTENLEINNFIAAICFPAGIKNCYNEPPPERRDFMTLITNRLGQKLYMVTYHFYQKIKQNIYDKEYEVSSLKKTKQFFVGKYNNLNDLTNDKKNEIEADIQTCRKMGYNDYVYVPFCIGLISKYPYINQIQQCLQVIYLMLDSQTQDENMELNEFIMYLINSVPIPNINTIIRFPLPYSREKIKEIDYPKFHEISASKNNIYLLLKYFRIKNIIRIIRLILFEKKIIFIDDDYTRLSLITNCFLSVIYPFQWMHTYIPIMSCEMFKYLESFLPFICGVHSKFLTQIKKLFKKSSNNPEDIVYLVYIEEDKLHLSDSLKYDNLNNKNKKPPEQINKKDFLKKNIPHFPYCSGYINLKKILQNIKIKMKFTKDESKYDEEIMNAFTDLFVEMFYDYNKYLYQLGEDVYFNKDLFLKNKKKEDRKFYEEFLDTQIFMQFKQDMVGGGIGYDNFKKKVSEKNSHITNKVRNATTTNFYTNFSKKKYYTLHPKFNHKLKDNIFHSIDGHIINGELKYINEAKYINSECIIFLMPEVLTIGRTIKENYNSKKFNSNNEYYSNSLIENEKVNEKEKEKIQETIKTYIVKIFKAQDYEYLDDCNHKFEVIKILNTTNYGRHYFVNLISKNLNNIIILPENFFELLFLVTYNTLLATLKLEENEKTIDDFIMAIKCTKHFGMEIQKNNIYTLWEKIKSQVKDFSFVNQKNFWISWFDLGMNNNKDLNEDQLIEVQKDILYDICESMYEMGINKKNMKEYMDEIMNERIEKNKELKKEITDFMKENFKIE